MLEKKFHSRVLRDIWKSFFFYFTFLDRYNIIRGAHKKNQNCLVSGPLSGKFPYCFSLTRMLHLFPSPAIFLAWQENSPSLPSVISNWVVEVKTAAEKVWIELSSWIYVGEVTDRIWGDLLGTSSTSRWEGRPSPGRRGRPPAPSPLQWWSTPACTPLSDWLEIDPVTTPILSFDEIRRDTVLWLVDITVLLRQLSYAIKNQRKAQNASQCKAPISHAYNRSFPCIEATNPYAIKNQRKARNAPSRGHFVPKPLVGGFECLELVLYGIRELA